MTHSTQLHLVLGAPRPSTASHATSTGARTPDARRPAPARSTHDQHGHGIQQQSDSWWHPFAPFCQLGCHPERGRRLPRRTKPDSRRYTQGGSRVHPAQEHVTGTEQPAPAHTERERAREREREQCRERRQASRRGARGWGQTEGKTRGKRECQCRGAFCGSTSGSRRGNRFNSNAEMACGRRKCWRERERKKRTAPDVGVEPVLPHPQVCLFDLLAAGGRLVQKGLHAWK